MTPGARVAAAIELLDAIAADRNLIQSFNFSGQTGASAAAQTELRKKEDELAKRGAGGSSGSALPQVAQAITTAADPIANLIRAATGQAPVTPPPPPSQGGLGTVVLAGIALAGAAYVGSKFLK